MRARAVGRGASGYRRRSSARCRACRAERCRRRRRCSEEASAFEPRNAFVVNHIEVLEVDFLWPRWVAMIGDAIQWGRKEKRDFPPRILRGDWAHVPTEGDWAHKKRATRAGTRGHCWRHNSPSKEANPPNTRNSLGRKGIKALCFFSSADTPNTWKRRARDKHSACESYLITVAVPHF